MTTPYLRLHLWLLLSSKPHQTRHSMPVLDLNVVEILRRISMITSCHLFNKPTMLSVQKFLSRILKFLMICNLCAQVHLLFYSTCTPLNFQITTFIYNRTRTQTMMLQSDLFIHLMIQYLLRYHHSRIALRRAPKITLSRRFLFFAGLAPLAVPRDAVVDYKANVKRLKAARHERVLRQKSTPLAVNMRLSRVGIDAVGRVRDVVRSLLKLIEGEIFERGASIKFACIRIPTNYLLPTQIITNAVLFFFLVNISRLYCFVYFYWINSYVI